MGDASYKHWVVFYTAIDPAEASIVLSVLQNAGVPALTQREGISAYVVTSVSVLVPRSRLQDAQKALDDAKRAAEAEEGDNGMYGD